MKNLAPDIVRQRLLIEGIYTKNVDEVSVKTYLLGIASHLDVQAYGTPTIRSPDGIGKVENGGFDAFLPLIDSGISRYVWESKRFFAAVLFTCKSFSDDDAVAYTRQIFSATEVATRLF